MFPGAELYPDPDSSDEEDDDDLEDNERNEENEEDGETGDNKVLSDPHSHRLEPEAEAAPLPAQDSSSDNMMSLADNTEQNLGKTDGENPIE